MSREEMRAVWVLQEFELSPPRFRYHAEWDASGSGASGEYHSHDLAAAIAWARARAPRIVVHLCVGTGFAEVAPFSAGKVHLPSLPAWSSAALTAAEEPREPGYGGWATIEEEPYRFRPLETFGLVEETQMVDGGRDVVRSSVERGLSLDEALRLARGRSEAVVVGTGWPGNYFYEDAGSRSYTPLPYPPFLL